MLFLTLVLSTTVAYSQEEKKSPPAVELPGTQLLTLASTVVGREYTLCVNLPRYYDDATRSFPVVYVLDAQWDFPLVNAVYGSQYYDGFVPGLIIVGITWGGPRPNHDSLRAADLTPTNSRQVPQSGNAPKFLRFIETELIPFVESKFRAKKDDRTLMGSSYGGLFTLYALFQETKLFNRYVLTSPAVGFDNEAIYSFEKNYAENGSTLPVRLFMAQGEVEGGRQGFEKLVDHFKSSAYEGLKLQTRILENIGHSGSKAEGYTRGLQWVFERPSLMLDPATLKGYEGSYEMSPGQMASVFAQNGKLSVRGPDNQVATLHAEGNDSFYAKGFYLNIRFKRDAAGTVAGVNAEFYNGSTFLKKVGD